MPEFGQFHFAGFTLHPLRRELARDGTPVALGSRAMDVLLALVRRHGQVATKTDIMAEVWGGLAVEENNLTTQIAAVRRALGDGIRCIETVPGRGYRFVADLKGPPQGAAAASTALIVSPAALAPAAAAWADDTAERHNLPPEYSSFIGRERELATIRDRMATRALVTLVGTGGVGKTRVAIKLAIELVESFADGALLLELAPLTEPRLVAEQLCRLLGAPITGERAPEDVATAVLRHKRMLLVFDNCEHMLASAASLASKILRHCPGIRILATSQQALGVGGEAVFVMPSLAVPPEDGVMTAAAAMRCDAVRLFAERAADALGSFTLTDEDAPAVVTICRRLDGVPLATELAAARLRMLKPREIAARLEDVFRLLTGGNRTALPRQQTLRATIDWSFSLLSIPEQIMLRRLSVFVDGCCQDGAVAVAADADLSADTVFDLISALVSKSLLVADTSGLVTRYRMLETTRQYAAEKLRDAAETCHFARMAGFMLQRFRAAEAAWPTTGTDAWLAEFAPEARNLRAAIDWAFGPHGEPALGVALVAQCGAISEEMSLYPDLKRWTVVALANLTAATPKAEAAAVLYLYTLGVKRLGTQTVPPERVRAIALFREAGDAVGLNRALRQTAIATAVPGSADPKPLALLEEAAALVRPRGANKDLATTLAHIGGAYFLAGNRETSRRVNETALAMRRALGDRTGVLASIANLAELMCLEGNIDLAMQYGREAEAEARRCNAVATLSLVLSNLAGYHLHSNNTDAAAAAAAEGLSLSRAIAQPDVAVVCLDHIATVLALSGAAEQAARLIGFTNHSYRAGSQVREWLEQAEHDRVMAVLNSELAAPRLNALIAEGAAWTAEEAYQAALPPPRGNNHPHAASRHLTARIESRGKTNRL